MAIHDPLEDRLAPLEIDPDEFRDIGHRLVDDMAEFLDSLPSRPVGPGKTAEEIRKVLGSGSLPERGTPAGALIEEATELLIENSLFNGHPRFWGYVTSSAAPISALAGMLASSINPNVGGWSLSPMASVIEGQTIRWIAELIGYPAECGGLLVSGGNTANFVGFLAARRKKLGPEVRTEGMATLAGGRPRVYCSSETHTWIEKAADQYGIGTDSIRWIPANNERVMEVEALRKQIESDIANGDTPFFVAGTGGTVAAGAVDPLHDIAALCREYDLWFHVDGAYGGLAACLPDASAELKGLSEADSVAIDPHKWLYSSLEAGCALVRDPNDLLDAYSYHPTYYRFDDGAEGQKMGISYYEFGPQNSRGFRALKVWLALRQVGRAGYEQMIGDDIRLAEELYRLADEHPDLEAFSQSLSITTFRYVPPDLRHSSPETEAYLSVLNEQLVETLQDGGETFVSNALFGETYLLRACIVNFRSTLADIQALPEIVVRNGAELDASLRPDDLRQQ